jgi:hypothetical protein
MLPSAYRIRDGAWAASGRGRAPDDEQLRSLLAGHVSECLRRVTVRSHKPSGDLPFAQQMQARSH